MQTHRIHGIVGLIRKTHGVVGLVGRGQGGRLVSSADVRRVRVLGGEDPVADLAADRLRRDVLRLVVPDDGPSVVGLLAAC